MAKRSIAADFLRVMAEAARNRTFDVCSRWAPIRRTMPDGEQYSLEDYPYVRGILDSRARKNWIMKGAQTGLSEAGFTIAFFEIDYHQKDVIYYYPTVKMAELFSKTRFSSAIKHSLYLSKVVTRDEVPIKQIRNATLYILGAGSDTSLIGISSGRVFYDEMDRMTERQLYLAEERTSGQKNEDVITWGMSTPIYPNTGIHKQYATSTQERWVFECPHCAEEIMLDWPDSFVVIGEHVSDPAVNSSYLKCSKCDQELPHATKKEWLKPRECGGTAYWKVMNPNADPALSRGFHVSQLYSPTQTPGNIAVKFLRGRSDEAARRLFFNDCLGLPFLEDAHQVNDVHIDDALKNYTLSSPETETINLANDIVTLGIDQGGDLHHWVAVKWKFYADREGDPNDRAVGRVVGLGQIPQDDWASVHGLMRRYQIQEAVIDYFPEPTNARKFARAFNGVVHLCQYVTGVSGREIRPHEDDYGASLVRCDDVSWMTKSLGRIMSGDLQLPLDLPLEFRRQVKTPVRSLTFTRGKYAAVYKELGTDDHYAHALVYAEIALKILDPSLHASSIITKTRE